MGGSFVQRRMSKDERRAINQRACFLAKDNWKLYRQRLEEWALQQPRPVLEQDLESVVPDIRDLLEAPRGEPCKR